MPLDQTVYPLISERQYCSLPSDCLCPEVLIIGSAIGSASADYLCRQARKQLGCVPRIVIAEAGPFDLWNHLGDTPGVRRLPYINNPGRMGGNLTVWGVSTPRPRENNLQDYPYPKEDLLHRFEAMEKEMGVRDPIPLSGGHLERQLLHLLRNHFGERTVSVAPLAINHLGRRWCPNARIPQMHQAGVQLLARFRCTELIREGSRITAVTGIWLDGSTWTLHPKFVFLAVGVESSIRLIRPIVRRDRQIRCSDHHRIDCHGLLPPGSLGNGSLDDLGVAVLIVELTDAGSGIETPYHLECKIAPWGLWKRGYMQSSDNLTGNYSDETLFIQIQAVAAMKHRLPASDLLNVDGLIPAVMSREDAHFCGNIIQAMTTVANILGLKNPYFSVRPLLANHHCYRAFEVGESVTSNFQFEECSNLYIAPPAAFFSHECDANPTLKSVILAQYAMDEIANRLLDEQQLCSTIPASHSGFCTTECKDLLVSQELVRPGIRL